LCFKPRRKEVDEEDIMNQGTTPLPTPEGFACPITKQLMRDPMTTKYSQHYERSAILKHFEDNGHYCPVTGNPLQPSNLVGNKTLQWKIRYWANKNGRKLYWEDGCPSPSDDTMIRIQNSGGDVAVPPERFLCPLTKTIMQDPVMTKEAVNYERAAILRWLDCSAEETCPVTQSPLTRHGLVSNGKLRWEIEQWQMQHGSHSSTRSNTVGAVAHEEPIKKLSSSETVSRGMVVGPSVIRSMPVRSDNDADDTDGDKVDNLLSALDAVIRFSVRA
jgi:hypothetical protein